MSRTLTNALRAAQSKRQRYPLARLTVRDVRLRFAQFTTQANPYALADNVAMGSENGVYGDQLTTPGGKILRVITNAADIRVGRATPATAASWATWTILAQTTLANTQPGLVANGATIYLFYVDNGNSLAYRTSANDGVTWGAQVNTGLALAPGCTLAPITKDLLYVCQELGTGKNRRLIYYRVVNNAGWTITTAPWSIYGNNAQDADWTSSGHTYFDAFTLGGADYLIVSDRSRGLGWAVKYQAGAWATPRWLLPDDYTAFRPYRVNVIQNRVWLTGRLIRSNASGWSPALDVYLYSDDGQNWTALARDSYLGADEVRGKLHLPGDGYAYYAGIYRVQRAPATYLIDPAGDLSANKLILTDEVVSAEVDYSAAGMAPEASVDLAAGKNDYFTGTASGIVAAGSDVDIELGYKTTVSSAGEFLTVFKGNIDGPELALGDGERGVSFTARDRGFKQLKDWDSALYWELNSQRKKHDDCNNMNNLVLDAGVWQTGGPNLLSDPSWELGTNPWSAYATGAGAGTQARSKDDASDGHWSWRIEKTAGANIDNYGSSTTFNALAGKTYAVSVDTRCLDVSGGTLSYTLSASGNYGAAGAAVTVTTIMTDIFSVFQTMTVSVVCLTSAVVTIAVYFDNATAGTLLVDNALAQDTAPGYLSTSEQDAEQVLFTPDDVVDDFDIRARYYDLSTAPAASLSMGVVGLGQDHDNYILFDLHRTNGSTYVGLWQKRDGNWSGLQTGVFTWAADGTAYDIRLVHRGGHFWGYAKAASAAAWGAPLVDYTWTYNGDKPCITDNGKGKVGVRARIQPFRFHASGLDEHSTVVTLRAANDLNWNAMPMTGQILWENERITYTGRTQTGVMPGAVTYLWSQDARWQDCHSHDDGTGWNPGDPNALSCHLSQLSWPWYVQIAIASPVDDEFSGTGAYAAVGPYALLSTDGNAQYDTWRINGFKANQDGATVLTTTASGHDNTENVASGGPNWHSLGPHIAIRPCLYGCTRGVGNTDPVRHTDNSLAYQYADDMLYLDFFESYDANEDWSNESALRRICAMAGVGSILADNNAAGRAYAGDSAGIWLQYALADAASNAFSVTDFELSLTTGVMGDGDGTGVGFWGSLYLLLTYTVAAGYKAEFRSVSPTGTLLESYVLPIQPTAGAALRLRFVVKGGFLSFTINGMNAGQFYTAQTPVAGGLIGTAKGHTFALSAITVPDLGEWREFAQVNEGESAQDSIGRLLEDRPVYQVSRVGVPKFSTFESRDDLGSFDDDFFSDQTQAQDTEIYTWPRVEAEEIMEQVDDTLARQYGLIHRRFAMQTAFTATAARMLAAQIRRMKGTAFLRSQELAGLLDWEPEDKFVANFTTAGALTAVNKTLIVNDLKYAFQPGDLKMTVTAREWAA